MEQKINKPFEWILNGRYRLFYHILFWIILYSDEILAVLGITEPLVNPLYTLVYLLSDIIVVYLNLYVLIPKFLLKSKTWTYVSLTAISVFGLGLLTNYLGYDPAYFLPEISSMSHYAFAVILPTFTLLGTAVGAKLFKVFAQSQQKLRELETSKLKTELVYLKDQMNPHFLFNALNNIYVLSRKGAKETPEAILLLSDLLRYQLYDCSQDKVNLKDELEYIRNYLKLDKLRQNQVDIKFEINGSPNGILVAPFLFLPFVENAIKHGIDSEERNYLEIVFNIKDDTLNFTIINSKPVREIKREVGGIGLDNVKRRLELLYPEKYNLDIENKKDTFSVNLSIPI